MAYWQDRMASAQNKISNKSVRAIETQMRRYYAQTMKKVIADFEATYDKLLATMEAGKEPTPADLYKLDKYWQMQAQARTELEKLGAKQVALLSKQFEHNWLEIYNSISLPGTPAFNTLDSRLVEQMISQIWCADGKSWSQRIWGNTDALLEELNEGLIHIVASGKKNTELKNLLQERFGVSYSRADALVRTEVAHIQTQAAQKRYEDYGVKMVEVWADLDERRCDVCGKLHQTKHPINGAMPIPAHTNCRCCIVPVVEEEKTEEIVSYQETIKRRREEYHSRHKPIEQMDRTEVEEWSRKHIKTNIDYKNSTVEAARATAQAIKELEELGIDLQDVKIVFGGTKGHYGGYVPKTRTIHLPPSTKSDEAILAENMRSLRKTGKTRFSAPGYRGIVLHEAGHAIDDLIGQEISKEIMRSGLYEKAVSISTYAGTQAAYGMSRASEATAENIAAYLHSQQTRENVSPEIRDIINKYIKKRKK